MKFGRHNEIQDQVLVEPDGTVFTSFMKTGFIKATTRTRYARHDDVAIGAFSITSALTDDEGATAPYALVFISEAAGQEKVAIIERFDTENDALVAGLSVQRAVRRYAGMQWYKERLQFIGRYMGLPLLVFIVSMSMVRFLDSHHGSLSALNAIMREANLLSDDLTMPLASTPSIQPTSPSAHAKQKP